MSVRAGRVSGDRVYGKGRTAWVGTGWRPARPVNSAACPGSRMPVCCSSCAGYSHPMFTMLGGSAAPHKDKTSQAFLVKTHPPWDACTGTISWITHPEIDSKYFLQEKLNVLPIVLCDLPLYGLQASSINNHHAWFMLLLMTCATIVHIAKERLTCDGCRVWWRLRLDGGMPSGPHPPLLDDIHEAVRRLAEAARDALAEQRGEHDAAAGGPTVALVQARHEVGVHPAARWWPVAHLLVPPVPLRLLLLLRCLQHNIQCCCFKSVPQLFAAFTAHAQGAQVRPRN